MMKTIKEDAEFKKMKQTVQDILDRHLPSDKKISVTNCNKEQIWYLCRLLLEKNEEKRLKIMKEIEKKYKKAKYEFYNEYLEILKHKEIFDNYLNIMRSTDDLLDDVDAENEINKKMDNI